MKKDLDQITKDLTEQDKERIERCQQFGTYRIPTSFGAVCFNVDKASKYCSYQKYNSNTGEYICTCTPKKETQGQRYPD